MDEDYEEHICFKEIIVVFAGFYKKFENGAVGFLAHSYQADQRWIFLVRVGKWRFGYRTRGDSNPSLLSWYDGGLHVPWRPKIVSGRG